MTSIPSSRAHVLFVEDDELVAERLAVLLVDQGLAIQTARSLTEARLLIEAMHYPVLILDRQLSDGDGLVLCQEYRARAQQQRAYVIVLTALGSLANVVEGIDAGVDVYLTKEASSEDIVAAIRNAINSVS